MALSSTQTAEIVTFRTHPGTTVDQVARSAAALKPVLARTDGFIARYLSRDDTGLWTDHIIWRDLASALAGAEGIMADPAAGPFMTMIDKASVRLTHAHVVVAQAAA